MKRFALVFASTAATLLAQSSNANGRGPSSNFSVPVLGFVASQSPAQLRPILGIPGSARLGNPLLLPASVTRIHVAPGQAFALVEEGANHPLSIVSLHRLDLRPRTLAAAPISGAMNQIDLLAFSPTGESAVTYSRQANQLRVLAGLPKSPRVAFNFENLVIPAPLQRLAVSDDAGTVLLSDEAGSVYSLTRGMVLAALHFSPDISALEFIAHTRDALIFDRSLNAASFLHGSDIKPVLLGPTAAGLCQPEAGVATADGKTILVACPAQHAILSVDRASGLTRVHHMSNAPTALNRLGIGDVFLMSPPEGGTYWLFVWGPGGPVRSFIAGARELARGSEN